MIPARTQQNRNGFSLFWPTNDILSLLAEKRLSQRKKFCKGKIFDFEIFVLKYVSKHSESIPKINFSTKNFQRFSFFGHFWLKMKVFGHFRIFLGQNKKTPFGGLVRLFITVILSYLPGH